LPRGRRAGGSRDRARARRSGVRAVPQDAPRDRDGIRGGRAAGRGGPVIDSFTRRVGSLSHLSLTWRDAVDILVVAILVYSLLRMILGTRAVALVLGSVGKFLV